jgi:hypothetical protein
MMTIVEFPVNKMDSIAEQADAELYEWCLEKIEQGLDPVYLSGVLQYNSAYLLSSMIEEE